jgi:hypothetical protein
MGIKINKFRDRLREAGANEQYLNALTGVVETLLNQGDDFDSIVARWKTLKPEWWTHDNTR